MRRSRQNHFWQDYSFNRFARSSFASCFCFKGREATLAGLAFCFSLTTLLGCAGNKLRLREWTDLPATHYAIPPYAQYLAKFKIALDPGHGGLSHLPKYKRGPTGKEEAVMNLSVALHLKEFLQLAGAQVIMTRDADRFVSLAERAEIAAREHCDFMISLHHNASERPAANFTSVFYHSHPDYSPVSMDLARAVYFGLVEALRLPEISPEGLLADKIIYPEGFGLLRAARMPALLLESSFFSNPQEEKRLMQSAYNRREAYGVFLGLARWAAGGVPSARLTQPNAIARTKRPEIIYELADGVSERSNRPNRSLAIFSETVTMRLDGERIAARLELAERRLRFQPAAPLRNGAHLVQVELQNLFKHHNLPRVDTIIVAAPTDSIHFAAPVVRLPADGIATVPIQINLFDEDGEPVWEGTIVQVAAERGTITNAPQQLQDGRTIIYYRSGMESGTVRLIAEADAHRDTFALELAPRGELQMLSGTIEEDSTQAALHGVQIMMNDSLLAMTDENGFFFVPMVAPGEQYISAQAKGYHRLVQAIDIKAEQSALLHIRLLPILGGLLHDQNIILDAASGGTDSGESFEGGMVAAHANLALARALSDSLQWAGAHVMMIRASDTTLATPARIERVNQIPQGWYVKLAYRKWERDSTLMQCTIYPGNQTSERIATAMNASFAARSHAGAVLLRNTEVPEVTLTNKTAVEIVIKCRGPEIVARDLPALFEGIVNYLREEKSGKGKEDPTVQ